MPEHMFVLDSTLHHTGARFLIGSVGRCFAFPLAPPSSSPAAQSCLMSGYVSIGPLSTTPLKSSQIGVRRRQSSTRLAVIIHGVLFLLNITQYKSHENSILAFSWSCILLTCIASSPLLLHLLLHPGHLQSRESSSSLLSAFLRRGRPWDLSHSANPQSNNSALSKQALTVLAMVLLVSLHSLGWLLTLAHRPPAILILFWLSRSSPIHWPSFLTS